MAGPIVGIVVLMVSVYHVYLAVFNYLSDGESQRLARAHSVGFERVGFEAVALLTLTFRTSLSLFIAYLIYASSALAAQSFCRNLVSFTR